MIGIQVDQLRKKLGPHQALDSVSTEFSPALLHGIIGPDGAGKTTLIRTLVGLLTPQEGHIRFTQNSQPVSFQDVRPLMAYMPQQQSLYADLSISEHLDFFRDLYQIPDDLYRSRRESLLTMTRLQPFQSRLAGQLSGGMYKKLGLMCALLQSPTVLLLDEPTNGVDPISRREFWDLLYQLKQQKILIIIATAYMDEAERCDEVHFLHQGKILAEGQPRKILEDNNITRFDDLFLEKAT